MRLKILKRHIDKGKPWGLTTCPIAIALKEKYPDLHCHVNYHELIMYAHYQPNAPPGMVRYTQRMVYKISKAGNNFLKNFDTGKPVKPLTVTLENTFTR